MNFDKESKSEEKNILFFRGGGGGGERERESEGGGEGFQPKERKQKTIGIRKFFVLIISIKFQVPGSSGSLVLTQTKGVTDR